MNYCLKISFFSDVLFIHHTYIFIISFTFIFYSIQSQSSLKKILIDEKVSKEDHVVSSKSVTLRCFVLLAIILSKLLLVPLKPL